MTKLSPAILRVCHFSFVGTAAFGVDRVERRLCRKASHRRTTLEGTRIRVEMMERVLGKHDLLMLGSDTCATHHVAWKPRNRYDGGWHAWFRRRCKNFEAADFAMKGPGTGQAEEGRRSKWPEWNGAWVLEGWKAACGSPQEHTKRQFYVCPRLSLIPDERSNHLPSNRLPPAKAHSFTVQCGLAF